VGFFLNLGPPYQGAVKYGRSNHPSIEPKHHISSEALFCPTCVSNYRKSGVCFPDCSLQMLVPVEFGVESHSQILNLIQHLKLLTMKCERS
jgi:hypothetical protein